MCTGVKKETVAQTTQAQEKPQAEPELVKVGAAKGGGCCDSNCGPSTCGA